MGGKHVCAARLIASKRVKSAMTSLFRKRSMASVAHNLMRFFRGSPAGSAQPTTKAPAQKLTRRSSGMGEVSRTWAGQEGLCVLDLGATSPNNIRFFTERGHKCYSEDLLLAPDILVAEVCNIAWRSARIGRIEPEQAIRIATAVPGLFGSLTGSGLLARRAVEIARELDHPVYDCLYLSLAEAQQTALVTADDRFLAKLSGTAWEASALSLVQYVPQC